MVLTALTTAANPSTTASSSSSDAPVSVLAVAAAAAVGGSRVMEPEVNYAQHDEEERDECSTFMQTWEDSVAHAGDGGDSDDGEQQCSIFFFT